ncbi:hypothetical protein BH23BAC4_BH23BAC4_02610 [soil metagenome]
MAPVKSCEYIITNSPQNCRFWGLRPFDFTLVPMPRTSILLALSLTLILTACSDSEHQEQMPTLTSETDSLAYAAAEVLGGWHAWRDVPYLRFTFASGRDGNRTPIARHAWDRTSGAYRVDWTRGEDSTFVAIFNAHTHDAAPDRGRAFANGVELEGAAARDIVAKGYRRYINDTYWFLAPVKLLDEGVTRELSAEDGTQGQRVLEITFGDVGLTPGDRYWITLDAPTARIEQWAYRLQSMDAQAEPIVWRWVDFKTQQSPVGELTYVTRRVRVSDGAEIMTDEVNLEPIPSNVFEDPTTAIQEEDR